MRNLRTRLFAQGDAPKGRPMPVYILDLIYIAIGVAAFAITALYLGACEKL
jgi:hypothetical protein